MSDLPIHQKSQEELDDLKRQGMKGLPPKKRVLVAITLFGNGKDYVLPKFLEMYNACIRPFPTVETRIYGDHNFAVEPTGLHYHHMQSPGWYAEDMLTVSREQARLEAIEEGFDLMMWHGVDALWQSPEDFAHMLNLATSSRFIVAPLISARNWAHMPITRRFRINPGYIFNHGDDRDVPYYSQEQVDVPDEELLSGQLIKTGFPGADNIIVPREYFHLPFADGHDPWYKRVAENRTNVCVEENWIWNVLNRSYPEHPVYCETAIKVWHVHEDGRANMYKDITKRLEDLSWRPS